MSGLSKFLALFLFYSLLAACSSSSNNPNHYKPYGTKGPFIERSNIGPAMDLRYKYPDADVADWKSEILIEFFLSEDDQKGRQEDDSLMTTPLKARVTYYHTFLALREHVNFQYAIFYNKQMKVGPISLTYMDEEDKQWITPTVTDMSYEVDGFFYSDARLKSFSTHLPALGTEVKVTYEVVYENVNYLANLFMHEDFPIENRNVILRIPSWLDIDVVEKNFKNFSIHSNSYTPEYSLVANHRRILDLYKYKVKPTYNWYSKYPKNKSEKIKKDDHSYKTYRITKLKDSETEQAAAGRTYNYPHLLFKVNSYKDPSGQTHQVLGSLENLYGWYRQLVLRIGNEPAPVAEKAKSLVAGLTDDEEKIKAIFYWVQDNIRYIAYEDGIAGFKPEPCQMVYANLYGDCKGMANLLAEMLKSVGYDARLTWIGTRHIAYNYSEPSMAVDNHMICTVFLNGKKYFLDGTEELIALNDYAHRIQGRQVLIEDGNNYLIDSIPDLPASRNLSRFKGSFRLVGDQLVGRMTEDYQGESRTRTLRYFNGQRSERKNNALERFLNRGKPNHQVRNIQQSPIFNRDSPAFFEYDLHLTQHVAYYDSSAFIRLAVLELPYKIEMESKRVSDIYYGYKINQVHEYSVEIPAGWTLSSKPEAIDIANQDFTIKLAYVHSNGKLTLHCEMVVHDGTVKRSSRNEWNEALKEIRSFYQHYVVFKQN